MLRIISIGNKSLNEWLDNKTIYEIRPYTFMFINKIYWAYTLYVKGSLGLFVDFGTKYFLNS